MLGSQNITKLLTGIQFFKNLLCQQNCMLCTLGLLLNMTVSFGIFLIQFCQIFRTKFFCWPRDTKCMWSMILSTARALLQYSSNYANFLALKFATIVSLK